MTLPLLHRTEPDWLNVCQYKQPDENFFLECAVLATRALLAVSFPKFSGQGPDLKRGANIRNRNKREQKETNVSEAEWSQ